jgi:parallel beta-helix repeat protein
MRSIRGIGTAALLGSAALGIHAGDLDPPGTPAPTPGPEPRTAVNATNTPGDADSTFRITEPGSYYLTGNFTGVSGKNGVTIAASDVTLDLMGFLLNGVTGSLSGIAVPSPEVNITIRNGAIQGWGLHGVDAAEADNSLLIELRASANGTPLMDHDGLRLGQGGVIVHCVSRGHPGEGISAEPGTSVVSCAVSQNEIGIAGSGIIVTDCSSTDNSFGGISVSFGTVTGCTSSFNDGHGIRIDRGSIIGCTAARNGSNGIWAGSDSTVQGNVCNENFSGAGIFAGNGPATSRIEGNTVASNVKGVEVTGAGNLIIRNTAHGNTMANYAIAAGNAFGPIVDVAGAGDLTTLIGVGHTHPWANFEY